MGGCPMRVSWFVAIVLWAFLCMGQEVRVAQGNGSVVLSVRAQMPYQLISREEKIPILGVECTHKGKKTAHLLNFSPGGSLVDESPEGSTRNGQQALNMTIGGIKQMTTWVPYGDLGSFTYFGKVESERLKFIRSLLSSGEVSISFVPFLTGVPTTSDFDLSKLRDVMDKHPECATK
jgi:hypothetical protein